MGSRLAAMIRKELSQLFRDVPILLFVVWAFSGAVYTGGHGISAELHNYPLAVLDLSRSAASRELVSRFRAPHFKIVGYPRSDAELVSLVDGGQASLAIVIPPDFERRAHRRGRAFRSSRTAASPPRPPSRGPTSPASPAPTAWSCSSGGWASPAGAGCPRSTPASAWSTIRTSSRPGSRACWKY